LDERRWQTRSGARPATHPYDFLLDLDDLDPEAVRAALEQQAADLYPPWPLDELLRALTR